MGLYCGCYAATLPPCIEAVASTTAFAGVAAVDMAVATATAVAAAMASALVAEAIVAMAAVVAVAIAVALDAVADELLWWPWIALRRVVATALLCGCAAALSGYAAVEAMGLSGNGGSCVL